MEPNVDGHVRDPFLEYAYLLDEDFTTLALIDSFLEFVWTERYSGYGDFEMVLPITTEYAKLIRLNRYLTVRESDKIMVIDSLIVDTDVENGDTMKISGKTFESFLQRRIIWEKYTCNDTVSIQDSIKKLLEDNAISPKDPKRVIPNLTFKVSEDEEITKLTSAMAEEYSNLYSVIQSTCEGEDLGFRINTDSSGNMEFELYFGEDRSWDQEKNPVVLFSNSYENLISSEYVQTENDYISTALVRASDEGTAELVRKPERTGLARREGYFTISYEEQERRTPDSIIEKTKEALKENGVTKAFSGEIDPYAQFVFNRDYFLGDIVQLENHYGYSGRCRITEVVRSRDDRGPIMTPSFVVVDDEEIEVAKEGDA